MHVEQDDVRDHVLGALEGIAARRNLGDDGVSHRREKIDQQRSRVVIVFGDEQSDLLWSLCARHVT